MAVAVARIAGIIPKPPWKSPCGWYCEMNDETRISEQAQVDEELAGKRLDQAAARLFPQWSRSRLQGWIRDGALCVDGASARPRDKVAAGAWLRLEAVLADETRAAPEAMTLEVVHRDDDLLVIDKPPGLVVHPAAGNPDGTLLNGLLHLDPGLARVPRAGIVHRLDKDTSGLLVVARTLEAHGALVEQLQAREFAREYQALARGVATGGGTVDAPIGRHPVHRTRMAVHPLGRPSVTHYRVAERLRAHTLFDVQLETGRTHQIRVHLAHVQHPIVGDPLYGGRLQLPPGAPSEVRAALCDFRRQALHARRLGLRHPRSGEWLSWERPMPDDMARLLACLRSWR